MAGRFPWVRHFPADFLTQTRTMKAAEVGIYSTLLALMFDRCEPLPFDPARLCRYCNASRTAFENAVARFVDDGLFCFLDGRLWSEKVQKEIDFREEKSQKAKSSAHVRHGKNKENQGSCDANGMLTEADAEAEADAAATPLAGESRAAKQSDEKKAAAVRASSASVASAKIVEIGDETDDICEVIDNADRRAFIRASGFGESFFESWLSDFVRDEAVVNRLIELLKVGKLDVAMVRDAVKKAEAQHG